MVADSFAGTQSKTCFVYPPFSLQTVVFHSEQSAGLSEEAKGKSKGSERLRASWEAGDAECFYVC